jgi:hypothetical protein
MTATRHETLLAISPPNTLPQLAPTALNLMPFHLTYTGPAEISTYFQPRNIPGTSSSSSTDNLKDKEETITVAAFRGRRLQAHTVGLPEGYTGLVLTAPPLPSRSQPILPTTHTPNSHPIRTLKRQESPIPDGSGLRRSPRRKTAVDVLDEPVVRRVKPKRVMQKFSMDSDDDDAEDEQLGEVDDEGVVVSEKVEVKDETVIVEEKEEEAIVAQTTITTTTTTSILSHPTQLGLTPSTNLDLDLDQDQDQDLTPHPLTSTQPIFSRTLTPQAFFPSLTLWNPDGPVDEGRDEYCRALGEWMRLNEVLHRV